VVSGRRGKYPLAAAAEFPMRSGKFGHGDIAGRGSLGRAVLRARKHVSAFFHFAAEFECQSRRHELFDGFFGSVLFLQAKSAYYRATRSAGCWCGFKKRAYSASAFWLLAWGRKPVKIALP